MANLKNANWQKQFMLTLWACGLMDQSQDVWTSSVRITTEYCKPPSKHKAGDDIVRSITINLVGMYASWVQSSYGEANAYRDALYQNTRDLEGQALSRKSKTLMQTALEMRAHADIILANLHNIAGSKTARDRWMTELAHHYPGYGFERHMGYPTVEHRSALDRLGPSAIHRRTFAWKSSVRAPIR